MNELLKIILIINKHLQSIKNNYRLNIRECYKLDTHTIEIKLENEIDITNNNYVFFVMTRSIDSDEQLFRNVVYEQFIKNIVFSRTTNNIQDDNGNTILSFRDIINTITNNIINTITNNEIN